MAVAAIKSIEGLIERGGNSRIVVLYVVTEGTVECGPATVFVIVTPDATGAKTAIADAVEADALAEFGLTIEQWGTPVPLGRSILFPDGTWALL